MLTIVENRALDLSYLKEMVGDNPEFLIEIFDVFLTDTPAYFIELASATDTHNWDAVANVVHKMKPTYVYIGRDDIKEYVHEIEEDARSVQNLNTLPERILKLKGYTEIIYKQLKEEKSKFSKSL